MPNKLTNNLIYPTLQLLTGSQHFHGQIAIRNRTRTLDAQPPLDGFPFVGVPVGIYHGIFHDSFGEGTVEFFGYFGVIIVVIASAVVVVIV